MSLLPSLPANLDPVCISCGAVGSLTSQLNTGITTGIATAQKVITGQTAQLQVFVAQASAASAATQAIINAVLSDAVIDALLEQFRIPPAGIPDIQCVKDELLKIHDQLNAVNEIVIKTLEGPPIDIGAAIEALIPPIPLPVIPSPGEIKEQIIAKLEAKRKEQQDAINKLQKQKEDALANAREFV